MDHSTAASLLIVSRYTGKDADIPPMSIQRESVDHGDAHSLAEDIAKGNLGSEFVIEVYRRISTYEAEVKVTMRKDG